MTNEKQLYHFKKLRINSKKFQTFHYVNITYKCISISFLRGGYPALIA